MNILEGLRRFYLVFAIVITAFGSVLGYYAEHGDVANAGFWALVTAFVLYMAGLIMRWILLGFWPGLAQKK